MSNFDDALERFHQVELEYAGGFANHGPMGAEALESLGHQALIPAFVDRYAPRVPPARQGRVLSPAERGEARGDFERAADWVATFEAELAGRDWGKVVAEEVPPLLPGLFAAAGHGLLRTVHALRALEREDSPLRRRELARGLAHWSARFQHLPGMPLRRALPGGAARERDPSALLEAWPTLPWRAGTAESFTGAVVRLDGHEAFRAAVESVVIPEGPAVDGFLAKVCRAAARLYLAHPDVRLAYAHAVTIPSAIRWLARRLPPESAGQGAFHAFQAVAALHALYGGSPPATGSDPEVEQTARSWDEIRYRAACSLDEHAIKLALACWQEDRDAPDPAFRRAAADAALRLDGGRSALRC